MELTVPILGNVPTKSLIAGLANVTEENSLLLNISYIYLFFAFSSAIILYSRLKFKPIVLSHNLCTFFISSLCLSI